MNEDDIQTSLYIYLRHKLRRYFSEYQGVYGSPMVALHPEGYLYQIYIGISLPCAKQGRNTFEMTS
jgi:hypothetical protein